MLERVLISVAALALFGGACATVASPKATQDTCQVIAEILIDEGQLTQAQADLAVTACDPRVRELYCEHAPKSSQRDLLCGE